MTCQARSRAQDPVRCLQSYNLDLSTQLDSHLLHLCPEGSENFPIILSTLDIPKRLQGVSWFAFCHCDKALARTNLGRKGFVSAHRSQSIVKSGQELKTGTLRQQLKQKPWRRAAYGLAQFAFLHNPGPSAQGWYHPQWPCLPQSLIKKIPSRQAPRPVWWRHLFNRGSLFQQL